MALEIKNIYLFQYPDFVRYLLVDVLPLPSAKGWMLTN